MKRWFVTGIGTEIGKTVAAAILVEALGADYWKPVQAGDLDDTDTMKVARWAENCGIIHPETYRLSQPMSPHAAANIDSVNISVVDFIMPDTANHLIAEGAGGLMVPINNEGDMIADVIKHIGMNAVLVSRNYLGSINHTLLSYELLKAKGIEIEGIIFNGKENKSTEEAILKYTRLPVLMRIAEETEINDQIIKKYANLIEL